MMRRASVRFRGAMSAVVVGILFLCGSGEILAISVLEVQPAPPTAARGGATNVCVVMKGSGGQVAGVQVDLSWDDTCLTPTASGTGQRLCESNPETGKNTQSAMSGGASLRALVLSVSDTTPMPDTWLFCCGFTVADNPSPQCPIRLSNAIASDPTGKRLALSTREGVVYVSDAGGQQAPAAGGAMPQAPAVSVPAGAPAIQAPAPRAAGAGPVPGQIPPQGVVEPGALPAQPEIAATSTPSLARPQATPTPQRTSAPAATSTPQRTPPTQTPKTAGTATPAAAAPTHTPKAKKK